MVLVAIGGGVAYSLIRPPIYEATASISVEQADELLGIFGGIGTPDFSPDKFVAANVSVVTEPDVLRVASEQLNDEYGIDIGLRPLRERVDARVNPDTNLIEIGAQAASAQTATRIANSVARATATVQNEAVQKTFTDRGAALEDELATLQQQEDRNNDDPISPREIELQATISRLKSFGTISAPVQVVEEAGGPIPPVTPRPVRDTALAAFLGLLLGLGAAIARESLDRRLHSAAEIQSELELPVIGLVRAAAMGRMAFSTSGSKPLEERDVEAYRILRANLTFLDVDREPRSVIVTSGLPEEGKSTVAASLAQASAAAGTRTLLLECDLRRPSLPERLGLPREPGLTDYLARRCEVSDILQPVTAASDQEVAPGVDPTAATPLTYIAAGSLSPRPAEALGSDRFREFLVQAMDSYEFVVIDTSPLLSVVDTRELVPLVDAVLLCVRVSRTSRDQMIAAKETLDLFPPRPTGVVITAVRQREEPDYGYYSYSY